MFDRFENGWNAIGRKPKRKTVTMLSWASCRRSIVGSGTPSGLPSQLSASSRRRLYLASFFFGEFDRLSTAEEQPAGVEKGTVTVTLVGKMGGDSGYGNNMLILRVAPAPRASRPRLFPRDLAVCNHNNPFVPGIQTGSEEN